MPNYLDRNSSPWSIRNVLIVQLDWFSTNTLNFLKHSKVWNLYLTKYTQLILLKLFVNNTKYMLPLRDSMCIGPHKSAWTRSYLVEALHALPKEIDILIYLPYMHPSQTPIWSTIGKPLTIHFWCDIFRLWCLGDHT